MAIEGTYLNIVKAIYDKTYSKHYSHWWETESIHPKIKYNRKVPTFPTIIQHCSGSPRYSNQKRKIKVIQIWKEVKLSLLAGDMTLCVENPKDSIRKWLEIISEFSNVAGYEINTQKSLTFLCTNNEKSEREIRNQSHSPLQQK